MPCVSREGLPGERLRLLLGVPRQQVAPGRAADGAGQGLCGDPAATEGERALIPLDLFLPVPDGAEPVAHRETLSADPCVSWCE